MGDETYEDYSSMELDMRYLTSNHPEDNYKTNLTDLRPESISGLNKIGAYFGDTYGLTTIITGGAETWTHESGEYSHHTGWKADIWINGVTPKTEAGQELISLAHENGWSLNWEDDHWDIDFSGHDTRDAGNTTPAHTSNSFWDFYQPQGLPMYDMGYEPQRIQELQDNTNSVLEVMGRNFLDSINNSALADLGRWAYYDMAYTGFGGTYDTKRKSYVQALSDEDIEYIETALPNDKEAQDFLKLHGSSSEMVRAWIANYQERKKTKEEIEQWKAGNDSVLASVAVAGAGLVGTLADPINFIPMAGGIAKGTQAINMMAKAMKGEQLIMRMGEAIHDVEKARGIANMAGTALASGIANAGILTADNYIKEKFGGQKVDYGADAGIAFLAGSFLGGLGRWWTHKQGTPLRHLTEKLETAETVAMKHASDMDVATVKAIRTETKTAMQELHDDMYFIQRNGTRYDKLAKEGKVIATTSDKAKELVEKLSHGKKTVHDNARAFYVPNEDYTVLLTDRIKPEGKQTFAQTIDNILAHELDVHGSLRQSLGEKGYSDFMSKIRENSSREGTNAFKARQAVGTDDPEEIWAYMVEHGMATKNMWDSLKGIYNFALKSLHGGNPKLKTNEVKDIFTQQNKNRFLGDIYVEEDGSTAFAGMRFSRDNVLNPSNIANAVELDSVADITQADLKAGIDPATKALRYVGKSLEHGRYFGTYFGTAYNSPSNTMRKYVSNLMDDARGRGGQELAMTAETQKQFFVRELLKPFGKILDIRSKYIANNGNRVFGRNGAMADFNRMCVLRYNELYGKHTATKLDFVPEEVDEAVKLMHQFRQSMIEMGKRTGESVGAKHGNVVDHDWYAVDEEWFRWLNDNKRNEFLSGNFFKLQDSDKSADDHAREFLTDYIRKAITTDQREIIREKIKRDRVMANNKLEAKNAKAKTEKEKYELHNTNVTDDEIDKWINEHIDDTVEAIMKNVFDPTHKDNPMNTTGVGHLKFFKVRIPMDTSLRVPVGKNGKTFALDDLRNFDLDDMLLKTANRFAGEAAIKNVFGTEAKMQRVLSKIDGELELAIQKGKLDPYMKDKELKVFKDAISELRGIRPEAENSVGQFYALGRIAGTLSYASKGANMGINQLGEIGGTVAYGGIKQMANIFRPLGEFVENCSYGKDSAGMLRDAENEIFGFNIEKEIWSIATKDRVISENLVRDTLLNKGLRYVGDKTQWLAKLTSTVNMLPHMTDSMTRGMRRQYLADSLLQAHGKFSSKVRNPFSDAKLKASNMSRAEFDEIMKNIKQFSEVDSRGHIKSFDYQGWRKTDPIGYAKWYDLCQKQADRAITNASKLGNKNVLKNKNQFTNMMFQFKDYALRSMNAQTMRAMTAKELDDFMATWMSVATNTMTYAMRAGAMVGLYQLAGMNDKAEEYRKRMFDSGDGSTLGFIESPLGRAIGTRSALIGTPFNFMNDAYEAITGSTSVRTTVNHVGGKTYQQNRDVGDILGDFVAQFPAIEEMSTPIHAYQLIKKYGEDKATQRDYKALLSHMPISNFMPLNVLSQYFMRQAGIPEKNRR